MAPSIKRRTPRTDANGNVLDHYRGLYETQALAAAHQAGVPGTLLHPAGWNGDDNDLTGFFAEQIYRVGDVNWTVPGAIDELNGAIAILARICGNLGVARDAAIGPVLDLARFKRSLHEARERHTAIDRGDDLPLAPEAFDASEAWNMPSGPAHEDHAHGLANGTWRCLS